MIPLAEAAGYAVISPTETAKKTPPATKPVAQVLRSKTYIV